MEKYKLEEADNAYIETFLPITTSYYLFLSGTPFRALNSGEFIEEQIFSWTYSDEQKAKESWIGTGIRVYDAYLAKESIKEIPGHFYDPDDKAWLVPYSKENIMLLGLLGADLTRLLYYGLARLHLSQDEVWATPFGLLLDLWECDKQYNGISKPRREHFIDEMISEGI